MGSAGSFLESGGFKPPLKWETVNVIDGIKVIKKKDNSNAGLPLYSNTPGTTYMLFGSDGNFRQIRKYGEDRKPIYDIDYHKVGKKMLLHIHYYTNNIRDKEKYHKKLSNDIYEKYENIIKTYIPKEDR